MRDEGGFTLVEMLVTLVVLSILVTLFSLVFQTTITRSATLTEHASLESEGRATVDTIANELRQAGCNGTTAPVVAASGSTLTFYTPDRDTPYHLREVSYSLSGTNLTEKQVTSTNAGGAPWTIPSIAAAPSQNKVRSVSNAIVFDFADSSGNDLSLNGAAVSAANLPNIEYATITLNLIPKASQNTGDVLVQAAVDLRESGC